MGCVEVHMIVVPFFEDVLKHPRNIGLEMRGESDISQLSHESWAEHHPFHVAIRCRNAQLIIYLCNVSLYSNLVWLLIYKKGHLGLRSNHFPGSVINCGPFCLTCTALCLESSLDF
jgi:hypothetical protein